MYQKLIFFFLLIPVFILIGCSSNEQINSLNNPYPGPILDPVKNSDLAYPSPINSGSASNNRYGAEQFQINSIIIGTDVVSGKGPAGIPIEIVDITFNEVIGSTIISEDNSFIINLANPILERRRYGVQISIQRDAENWQELWALRGDNARSIPNIGYFLDTVISETEEK